MAINKVEGVRADDIVFYYNGQWYCIPFIMLITVACARARYGLVPSAESAIDNDLAAGPNVQMTLEIQAENEVRELRQRWIAWATNPVDDIKALITRNPTEFTTVLASCIIP